ncbi:trichohyalin-like [Anneissia japonica]|uniref:trichohyalin-like n=1 Tax=Anneissia japonica TaxID=1529436 RepID=UPI00142558F1|nr:trichohyalin-like [Anneissia japonica]
MTSGKLVLPFDTSPRIRSRYDTLVVSHGNDYEGEDDKKNGKEYAAFLREQERKCGPDGYLDSSKYTHTFELKGKVIDTKQARSKQNGATKPELAPLAPTTKTTVCVGKPKADTVVDLMSKIIKDEKDFNKRMKVIEDHMLQHKQEERELKRSEGDVIKNQQQLRRTMRDYENAILRKKQAEARKILENQKKEFFITRDHVHRKEQMNKSRIEQTLTKAQQDKDEDRKVFVSVGDLERKYRAKIAEIEMRRTEVMRLNEEYTKKLKMKEEETFKLNRDLAEIALAVNMEAQKRRAIHFQHIKDHHAESKDKMQVGNEIESAYETKVKKTQIKGDQFENNRRRLSLDLTVSKSNLEEKSRDEGRQLLDTRNRLQDNFILQKQLQESALNAKLDLKSKKMNSRLQAHESRKQMRLKEFSLQKRRQYEQKETQWEDRFQKRNQDSKRRENEDNLKHITKEVNKLEEVEHDLFNRVRNAEYTRKQREQMCKRLKGKLLDLRRKNAETLKRQMLQCLEQEKEVEQKLLREQAELDKAHVNREENYLTLQQHRIKMREDQYVLSETAREHNRLMRIGEKTDDLSASVS